MDYQTFLLEHLDLIDRIVHVVARRHHLTAADTEELTSLVRYKLIDRDFAILRKFEGRSSIATFLTVVIERLYLDYCISRWGKWRPSAAARRLGAVATELERLVSREGLTFDEAVGTLQTNQGVRETRDELHALWVQLPVRAARRLAGEREIAGMTGRVGTENAAIDRRDDRALATRVEKALSRALGALSHQDQVILRLRFQDGVAVAQIARAFSDDPKRLYKRVERILAALGEELAREGIGQADIDRIVGHADLVLGCLLDEVGKGPSENGEMRPSNR